MNKNIGQILINQQIDSRTRQAYPIYKLDETIGSAVQKKVNEIKRLSWWKRLFKKF